MRCNLSLDVITHNLQEIFKYVANAYHCSSSDNSDSEMEILLLLQE